MIIYLRQNTNKLQSTQKRHKVRKEKTLMYF